MVSEGLFVAGESDGIAKAVGGSGNDETVVVFVGFELLTDMLLGNADAQSDGFFGMGECVLAAYGVVGSPTSTQALLIGEFF